MKEIKIRVGPDWIIERLAEVLGDTEICPSWIGLYEPPCRECGNCHECFVKSFNHSFIEVEEVEDGAN